MASRQEEKEKRRAERMAAEEQARAGAARARRLQMVGGIVLVAAVAVVAVILLAGGGDSGDKGKTTPDFQKVAIPPPGPNATGAKLAVAAKDAGCVAKTYGAEGREHTTSPVKYLTNPPTSGNHNPTPAEDGVYAPGSEPDKGNFVHTLEHGRIEIQYKKGTPKNVRDQLETLFNEKFKGVEGYHQLLFENNTNMPYAVAATAWTHLLGCKTMNDKVFDAIRAFRDQWVDKAPEQIP